MTTSIQSTIRAYFFSYFPILLWTGFIFALSNQPSLPGPDLFIWDFLFKKSAHMFVYLVLFLLMNRAMLMHTDNTFKATSLALLFTVLYAMTDEFHQSFIPGRTSTIRDLGYDFLGASIGWLWLHKYI